MVMEARSQYEAPRTSPFEALGTKVETNDLDEIIRQAGLDFQVETVVPVVDGIAQEDFRAIRRVDTGQVFGFSKKGYTPVQNRQGFEILEGISAEIDVVSAGTFRGGSRVWIQAKLHHGIDVAGDLIDSYLTLWMGHGGDAGLKVALGFLRLGCTNQLPAIGRQATATWSHRHSTNVMANSAHAGQVLGLAERVTDDFEAEVRRLIETEVTNARFEEIVKTIVPASDALSRRQLDNVEDQRNLIRAAYESPIDGGAFAGTGWGVVNAVNSWGQWAKPVKSFSDRAERVGLAVIDGTFGRLTEKVAAMV